MTIVKEGFSIIEDNEAIYYTTLISLIEACDSQCTVAIVKSPSSVTVRISPSFPTAIKPLMRTIKDINSTFGINVEFSKSIKSSSNITYRITLH